jgi:hypothetical protein
MGHLVTTNITLPFVVAANLKLLAPANIGLFIRVALAAYVVSKACKAIAVAMIPHLGKCINFDGEGSVKTTQCIQFTPVELKRYRRIAKVVAGGSLSKLAVAAMIHANPALARGSSVLLE